MTVPELKRIDRKSGTFPATMEGKPVTFFVQDFLSVDRYIKYLQLLPELTYGVTFKEMHEKLMRIYELATHGNDVIGAFHQIATEAFNQISAIKNFDDTRFPKILEFCALFINYSGEDITIWDDRVAKLKIDAWRKEGYAMNDFFFFAFNAVQGFKTAYQSLVSEEEGNFEITQIPDGMTTEHAGSILQTSSDNISEHSNPESPST